MLCELGQDLFSDTRICWEVTPVLGYHLQHFLYSDSLQCVSACVLSHLSCLQLCVTPGAAARQAPLSTGFPRQEYRSGLPCPPPGDLPDLGIKPTSLVSCISRQGLYHERHLGGPNSVQQGLTSSFLVEVTKHTHAK